MTQALRGVIPFSVQSALIGMNQDNFECLKEALLSIAWWLQNVFYNFNLGQQDPAQRALCSAWPEMLQTLKLVLEPKFIQQPWQKVLLLEFKDQWGFENLNNLITHRQNKVPLELIYAIPMSESLSHNLQPAIYELIRRTSELDSEQLKHFSIKQYSDYLHSNCAILLSPSYIQASVALACMKLINSQDKSLEGTRFLSEFITSHPDAPHAIYTQLQNERLIHRLLADSAPLDLLLQAAVPLGLLARNEKRFRMILAKLPSIQSRTRNIELIKDIARHIFSHLNQEKVSIVMQLISASQLELEILFEFVRSLNPLQHSTQLLSLLSFLANQLRQAAGIESFLVQYFSSSPQVQELFFTSDNRGLIFPLAELLSEASECSQSLKDRFFDLTLSLVAQVREDGFRRLLNVGLKCASAENVRKAHLSGESSQQLVFFVANLAEHTEDLGLILSLGAKLAELPSDEVAFESFLRVFYKINQERSLPGFMPPVKRAPFLMEECLLSFYLNTEASSIRIRSQSLLVFLFTVFDQAVDYADRKRMQQDLAQMLSRPESSTEKVCALVLSALTASESRDLQVTLSVQNSSLPLKVGVNQDLRHLRLCIAELLGTSAFTVCHQTSVLLSVYDQELISRFIPPEFSVYREADQHYLSPLEAFTTHEALTSKLLLGLEDDQSFSICWQLLHSFYRISSPVSLGGWALFLASGQDCPPEDLLHFYVSIPQGGLCRLEFERLAIPKLYAARLNLGPELNRSLLTTGLNLLRYSDRLADFAGVGAQYLALLNADGPAQLSDQQALALSPRFEDVLASIFAREPCGNFTKILSPAFVSRYFSSSSQQLHFCNAQLRLGLANQGAYWNYWKFLRFTTCASQVYVQNEGSIGTVIDWGRETSFELPNYALAGSLKLHSSLAKPIPSHLVECIFGGSSTEDIRVLSDKSLKYALLCLRGSIPQVQATLLRHQSSLSKAQGGYSNLKPKGQPAGLKNLGNSCYLNCLVQQLFHLDLFRDFVFRHGSGPLSQRLTVVFQELAQTCKKYINIKSLFGILKGFDGESLNPKQQQDADEIFSVLLTGLEPELPSLNPLFGGTFAITIRCDSGHLSQRAESFTTLPVDVQDAGLVSSLHNVQRSERLQGNNQYFCEQCGHRVDASMTTVISSLSHYLVIHLKRFDYDFQKMTRVKLGSAFEFPLKLVLQTEYALKGVIVHIGPLAEGGHYVVYIRRANSWWAFNDTVTNEVSWAQVQQQAFGGLPGICAYILFYERGGQTDIRVPAKHAQAINERNFRAFHKRVVFSKAYSGFVSQHLGAFSFGFALDFLFSVQLRIVQSCPYSLKAVLEHLSRSIEGHRDEFWSFAMTRIDQFFIGCGIRVVRQIMRTLLAKAQPEPRRILDFLASLRPGVYYLSDCFALLGQVTEESDLQILLEYLLGHVGSLRSERSKSESYEPAAECSVHRLYELFADKRLLGFTSPEVMRLLLVNLKNADEAFHLGRLCQRTLKEYPDCAQAVYQVFNDVFSAFDVASLHLLVVFQLEMTGVDQQSDWLHRSQSNVGYHFQVMRGIYERYLRAERWMSADQPNKMLEYIYKMCAYYEEQAAAVDFASLRAVQMGAARLANGQGVTGSKVSLRRSLEYFKKERQAYQEVVLVDQFESLVLIRDPGEEFWTDVDDKALRNI